MNIFTRYTPVAFFAATALFTSGQLWAEDVEVYYSEVLSDDSVNKNIANVMIMLDTSGSMRYCESGSYSSWCGRVADRRINILNSVMESIIDDADENVHIGLGRFVGGDRGKVILPVLPVNERTRGYFADALKDINPNGQSQNPGSVSPSGNTPTSRAYEEMARYMLGDAPGTSSTTGYNNEYCVKDEVEDQCSLTKDYLGREECRQGEVGCDYVTDAWELSQVEVCPSGYECRVVFDAPVSYWPFWPSYESPACVPGPLCQLTTGGLFEYYYAIGHREQRKVGFFRDVYSQEYLACELVNTGRCAEPVRIANGGSYQSPSVQANQCESNHIILFTDGVPNEGDLDEIELVSCEGVSSYECQVKLAGNLNRSSNAIGREIKTHNIGLYMGRNTLNDMRRVSTAGGGSTYNSDNADSLLLAFKQTLDLIADEANTMVSPGVAVSQSQRFQHLDEMYFSLFKPLQNSFWNGNLKRYRVEVDDGEATFYDASGSNAMTGSEFSSSARSWWSRSVDGADIMLGGARDRLQTTSRRLFYTDSPGGKLRQFNLSDFTNAQLLLPPEATDAVRGNVERELLNMWGDPLHSRPLMVNYGGTTVGEDFVEDNIVFVSTNAGMLHAIDTRNGDEKFAFMPYEFISKASSYTVNRLPLAGGNKRQTYGLDGSWSVLRQPGASLEDAPSKVMIYGGMRRGGNSYFALDVTTVSSPQLKWQISGGTGDFIDLGQTWSTPKVARFPDGDGGSFPVVIFGGGYSPADHDGHQERRSQDEKGNAIYVVNANSGKLVWSAGSRTGNVSTVVPSMTHSVPGSIAVVDSDSDGVADHLYFADLGGQLFRADIGSSGSSSHSVTLLAQLGGSGENHRRFYEQPTVSYVREGAYSSYYVSLASGYRSHPLDVDTQDALFVLRDREPFGGTEQSPAELDDFTKVSTGTKPDPTKRGWYMALNKAEGEKSLSSPAVFNYEVLFTTYSPNTSSDDERDPCSVSYGQSYLHRVNLLTGQGERYTLLQPGLPPGVTVLFGEDGDTAIVVGTETPPESAAGGGGGGGGGGGTLRDLRHGRWMQLTPDAAGAIKQPQDEDGEGD